MRKHDQTIFYLENLQPDWLTPRNRRIYTWLGVSLPNILIGVLVSLTLFMFVDTLLEGASELNAPLLIIMSVLGGLLGALVRRVAPGDVSHSYQSDHHGTERE